MRYLIFVVPVLLLACSTDFTADDVGVEDQIEEHTDVIEDVTEEPTEDPVEDVVPDYPVIDTSEPPECESAYSGGECNVFSQCGCGSGMKCDFHCRSGTDGWSMYETCIPAGTDALGEDCADSQECEPGLSCAANECVQFCQTSSDCPEGLRCWQFLTTDDCGEPWESDAIICWE